MCGAVILSQRYDIHVVVTVFKVIIEILIQIDLYA